MPTYEFLCVDCKKSFSIAMTMDQYGRKRRPKCPRCESSRKVQRKVSGFFALTSKKS